MWALLAQGLSNQDIADGLTISLRAVENYINSLFDKLGLDGHRSSRRTKATLLYQQTPESEEDARRAAEAAEAAQWKLEQQTQMLLLREVLAYLSASTPEKTWGQFLAERIKQVLGKIQTTPSGG